ncbi:hypothetical protein A5482_006240 [Cyanobacterium sp. IPPAS B-1200]|uniref:hypothetical protein n=1 Tax=Cyanobacterium sp. IPPAS B-1200 TaxID=1562720 RepID=UPI0008526615|nr:hypothetical protein [Cyanobacterium sp. IPPAS B-1200]OEJ77753.1 hypothetical protein A5482_04310 [Cyanobacterium sp. IPPAS B-1200]
MVNTSLINLDEINEPIQNAKPEVKSIIEQVLTLEKERLYNNNLRHINDDVLKIIKQNIQ